MDLAFFSFITLESATAEDHRAYNEWHQLDHRPENLALPGVAWGDRWGRPDACKEASHGEEPFTAVDYMAMYWFRQPVEQSVAAWDRLGADSFQWGRGPLLPGVRRPMLAFYRPVRGYAARSALVNPEVIPYRPNRGLHVTLTRHADPHAAAVHDRHRWEDRCVLPALMDVEGVAGAWTFSFSHSQQHSTLPMTGRTQAERGSLRIRLVYLDGDPLETTARIEHAEDELARRGDADPAADQTEVLLSTPLRTIIPWQDW